MNIRTLCALACWALTLGSACGGVTYTTYEWTGGGADAKWSTAANWKGGVAPVSGNATSLVFNPTNAPIVCENDIEDFTVARMLFSKGDAYRVTVNGERIKLCDGNYSMAWSNECPVVCNADLSVWLSCSFHCWGATNAFNGDISIRDTYTLTLGDNKNGGSRFGTPSVEFYGDINGPKAIWYSNRGNSGVRMIDNYFGAVNVMTFKSNGTTSGGYMKFWSPENACTNILGSYGIFYFLKPNQFAKEGVLNFYDGGYGGLTAYLSAPQTFRRIISTCKSTSRKSALTTDPTTSAQDFTVLAEAGEDAILMLNGAVNFIWAPTGDFTFTNNYTTSATTGSLVISNGAYRVANQASFSALASVRLFNGGRFEVASDTPNPFGTSPKVRLSMHGSSRLVLDADCTVAAVLVDGTPLAVGSHTAATLPSRISGTGTLTVLSSGATYWMGADNGLWSVAGNWSDGLPSASNPACVANDDSRTVTFDTNTYAGALTVASEAGKPVVKISDDTELSGAVTLGGSVAWAATSAGTLWVSDGKVVHSNGTYALNINPGGLFKMTGGTYLFGRRAIALNGGEIDLSGDAVLKSDYTASTDYLRTGTVRLSGNAYFQPMGGTNSRIGLTPGAAGETLLISLTDHATLYCRADGTYLNGRDPVAGAKTKVELSGSSCARFGNSLRIALGSGTEAELEIRDNAYAETTWYSTCVGGQTGTDPSKPAKGVLRISGGAFNCQQSAAAGYPDRGFSVGYGLSLDTGEAANLGWLYLSGGAVTNGSNSAVVIGGGAGRGYVVQTGGEFLVRTGRPTVIGLRGGTGSWDMSAGSFASWSTVYVGGLEGSALGDFSGSLPTPRPGFGSLKVTGGEFKMNGDLWVSREGCGSVEIGPAGCVSCANAYFTNSVDQVDGTTRHASTLKFAPGADGCGTLVCSGAFEAAPDARLIVDVSSCGDSVNRLTLMKAGRIQTPFAAANVTVEPAAAANRWRILPSAKGYALRRHGGLAIFLR